MAENRKTKRILGIFHLLNRRNEASFKEVTDIKSVSKKTVYRDICILRQIGYQIEYVKKAGAFVMLPGKKLPNYPENMTRRRYLKKISRLTNMMNNMDGAADPAEWYREKYPELSARTMQRDFKTLTSIGYEVNYMRGVDERGELPAYRYYCVFPGSIDDIYAPC